MGDDTMTPEDKAELLRSDEEFALLLQKQFNEEMLEINGRAMSPDLVAHPASPIGERLSSFTDSQVDPGFGEELSAQLLKHIKSSTTSSATQTSRCLENGTSNLNGLNVHFANQPSTSSTCLSDEQLSEEYARRLQQEFDNESKLMSTPNNQSVWDPISEWRTDEEDENLKRALEASLMEQPCSSKSTHYSKASSSSWEQEASETSSSAQQSNLQNFDDQEVKKGV